MLVLNNRYIIITIIQRPRPIMVKTRSLPVVFPFQILCLVRANVKVQKFSPSNLDIFLKGTKLTLRDLLKCQNAIACTVVSISVFMITYHTLQYSQILYLRQNVRIFSVLILWRQRRALYQMMRKLYFSTIGLGISLDSPTSLLDSPIDMKLDVTHLQEQVG